MVKDTGSILASRRNRLTRFKSFVFLTKGQCIVSDHQRRSIAQPNLGSSPWLQVWARNICFVYVLLFVLTLSPMLNGLWRPLQRAAKQRRGGWRQQLANDSESEVEEDFSISHVAGRALQKWADGKCSATDVRQACVDSQSDGGRHPHGA